MPAQAPPIPPRTPLLGRISLKVKFALLVIAFFALPAAIGGVGLNALHALNEATVEISQVWLERIRLIGDLQTRLTDYRRQEASHVIAFDERELVQIANAAANTASAMTQTLQNYRRLDTKIFEESDPLYSQFTLGWQAYQRVSSRLIALSSSGDQEGAVEIYRLESRSKFSEISAILDAMTKRDLDLSDQSRRRAAVVYQEARTLYLSLLGGVLVLAIAAMILLYADFSRPLLGLEHTMRQLAAGAIDTPIPHLTRHDEIGGMAQAIEVFRDNAAALTSSLVRERELMDQQRNFITMASHEFRTPLTGIDGHARRLLKLGERATAEDITERCGRIRAAVVRMTDLIDSVTRTAQWDDAAPLCHIRQIDIEALLREVVNRHRDQHPRRTVELVLSPLPDVMDADPKLVEHAVGNLVSNALKYSPPGEPVTVTAAQDTDRNVVISVIDRGVGIPDNERDRILGRFYRASNVAMTPGTGVGLYFVDQITKMHGGDLTVDSRLGEGSRFTLRLPIQQSAA